MSIIAKQLLVKELESKLGEQLTAPQVSFVVDVLNDRLSSYELERSETGSDNTFDEVLNVFIDTKQMEGRSPKTLTRYRYILGRFRESVKVPIKSLTVFHIRGYLMQEKNRGISDSTIDGLRDVFCSFFSWSFNEGFLDKNPCANLNKVKCQKKVKLPFSDVEIEKLKMACKTERDKSIIMFLLSTGCRISEACQLNRSDLDFHEMECTVLGKGNKERTVYFDNVAAMLLQSYLNDRTDDSDALFVGKGAVRLQPGGVRGCLNKIGARAGVENVHPHRFRRTLATNLINRGMSVQEVASILGHENINTTMTYIYINKSNVKSSYQKHISYMLEDLNFLLS